MTAWTEEATVMRDATIARSIKEREGGRQSVISKNKLNSHCLMLRAKAEAYQIYYYNFHS